MSDNAHMEDQLEAVAVRKLSRETGAVIETVVRSGRPVVVTAHGRPQVAIVPLRGRASAVPGDELEGLSEEASAGVRETEADLLSGRLLEPDKGPPALPPAEEQYAVGQINARSPETFGFDVPVMMAEPYGFDWSHPLRNVDRFGMAGRHSIGVAPSLRYAYAQTAGAGIQPVWASVDDSVWTTLPLPGVSPEFVSLHVEAGMVTILIDDSGHGTHVHARFQLLPGVDINSMSATLELGLLRISFARQVTYELEVHPTVEAVRPHGVQIAQSVHGSAPAED